MKDYPVCRFKNVVFAGSVVSSDFDWPSLIKNKRIEKIVNIIASADWIVAVFPKTFQTLRLQDLGSAGHDGFSLLSGESQLTCIKGSHSAGVREGLWDHIADFIVTGSMPNFKIDTLVKQNNVVRILGWTAPLIFCALIVGTFYIGFAICQSNLELPWKIVLVSIYSLIIWKIITRY